jgi:hypothetical protein
MLSTYETFLFEPQKMVRGTGFQDGFNKPIRQVVDTGDILRCSGQVCPDSERETHGPNDLSPLQTDGLDRDSHQRDFLLTALAQRDQGWNLWHER